jgi:hypothetical protein
MRIARLLVCVGCTGGVLAPALAQEVQPAPFGGTLRAGTPSGPYLPRSASVVFDNSATAFTQSAAHLVVLGTTHTLDDLTFDESWHGVPDRVITELVQFVQVSGSACGTADDRSPAFDILTTLYTGVDFNAPDMLAAADSFAELRTAIPAGILPCGFIWRLQSTTHLPVPDGADTIFIRSRLVLPGTTLLCPFPGSAANPGPQWCYPVIGREVAGPVGDWVPDCGLDRNGDSILSGGGAGTEHALIDRNALLRLAGTTPCNPDYNQDGNVDQDDVAYLVNVIAGGPNPTGRDPDFNGDGNIDQDDYRALVDVVAGGPCP